MTNDQNGDTTPTSDISASENAQLRELLLSEVPAPGADYWSAIDAQIEQAVADQPPPLRSAEASSLTVASGPATTEMPDISVECRTGLDEPHPSFARRLGWPAAIAATLLLLVGLVAVVGNRRGVNNNDVAAGDPADSATAPEGVRPLKNYEHWHAVYGVWDCTLNEGAGDWLAHFESSTDSSGIHSHDDGLIHIHPFHDWSAGENAQLGLFATEMGVELSDDVLVLNDGRRLAEGQTTCDGQPAVLHLRRWEYDFIAKSGEAPELITENLANARFLNDREVWVIAYAPLDAELPLPPEERFTLLNAVTGAITPAPFAPSS